MNNQLSVTMSRREMILGLVYLAVQLLLLPILLVAGNALLGNLLSDAQINFVFFAIDFLCVTLIFHKFLLHSAKLALTSLFRCLRSAAIGLMLYWIASTLLGMLILYVYPGFSNVNDQSIMELTKQNQTLMSIGTVFLVPVAEETLYRGVIFGGLYRRNRVIAYLVSTLVFGALHVVGYIGLYEPLHLIMCFAQYIPAGLCLAYAYVKADTIWAPILMHISINQIGILAMR